MLKGTDFAVVLSFLSFPLGGVVRKLGGNSCVGSVDGLYKSIADINEDVYFMSKAAKNRLVDPHLLPVFKLTTQILPIHDGPKLKYFEEFYNGAYHFQFLKGDERANGSISSPLPDSEPTVSHEGIVKGPRMYVATDDLVVAPASPSSDLNLISRSNTSFLDLKEKFVTIALVEVIIHVALFLPVFEF